MNFRRPLTWLLLFGFFTAIGLLFFAHFYLDDLARHHDGTLARRLMEELTGAYATLALVPMLVWIVGRFPPRRGIWRLLAATGCGFIVYTLAHTTLIALSRALLSPVLGLGSYDYGDLGYRYIMEASGDAIYYAMMIAGLYFADHIAAARRVALLASELEAKLAHATLQNLRLQLHPHFLFNTLNAVSAVMYEDVARADAMLTKLSDFLRRVLSNEGATTVTLAEELEAEQMYVAIMALRLERPFRFHCESDDGALAARVPFLLLQPLLENAIKHGAAGTELAIDVRSRRTDAGLFVDVCDNGRGYTPGATPGIGLTNVQQRLRYTYGDAARFDIGAREGGGTRAAIRIPAAELV